MATQQVLLTRGTPIVFKESNGQSAVITLKNLATVTGRLSAQFDRGAGSKPERYLVMGTFQFEAAPVVGVTVDLYLFQSDGTYPDGNVGTADAGMTAAQKTNGVYIGSVVVQTTATATPNIQRFVVPIQERYFSLGVWNGSAVNLKNSDNVSLVIFTPVVDDVQASA